MKIADVKGPVVDPWLIQQLQGWGIESLTDFLQRALLRAQRGTLSAVDLLTWLGSSGVAELGPLGGNTAYIGM